MIKRLQPLYALTTFAVLLTLAAGFYQLSRTALPSADVVANGLLHQPLLKIADFDPGDAEVVLISGRPIIVWRRDEADKALAMSQDNPAHWREKHSYIFGQGEPVFASDANLTLDHEWFFASAELPSPFAHVTVRAGDYQGFFEGRLAGHFDLAGRIRSGANTENLTVIRAEFAPDGESILLYLNGMPVRSR